MFMILLTTTDILNNIWDHSLYFLAGSTGLSIVAHAVNTCPTPKNSYGAWLLGVVQYAVGQRVAARNTLQGKDTVAVGVDKPINPAQVQDAVKTQVQYQERKDS